MEQKTSDFDIFIKNIIHAHAICASCLYLCVMIKEVDNINTYCHEHKAYEYFGMHRGDC